MARSKVLVPCDCYGQDFSPTEAQKANPHFLIVFDLHARFPSLGVPNLTTVPLRGGYPFPVLAELCIIQPRLVSKRLKYGQRKIAVNQGRQQPFGRNVIRRVLSQEE